MQSIRVRQIDHSTVRRAGLRLGLVVGILLGVSLPALAGHDWNRAQIDWQTYDKGLASAKTQLKPVCIVFYTEWCPHCANYSKVFHDAAVVAKSKSFVMILLDKDQNKETSALFAVDGQYIPRTYFLSPEGKLDPDLHAPREQYKFFYDEKDAASILAGMDAALAKFAGKGPAGPPDAAPSPSPAKGQGGTTGGNPAPEKAGGAGH